MADLEDLRDHGLHGGHEDTPALRLRLPHLMGDGVEVVAINTAGGLTGGDRFDLAVDVEEQAHAVVTTAACEKIYRAADGEAVVKSAVTIGSGARLEWLPQPMITFDGARVRRSLSVDVAVGATLLAVEGVILGRTAMGEELRSARIRDGWRVRRAGALIYADAFVADGDLRGDLAGQATLRGARAFATVLYVAPDEPADHDPPGGRSGAGRDRRRAARLRGGAGPPVAGRGGRRPGRAAGR